MLGSLILYLKGMRILMFQLSGFYCRGLGAEGFRVYGELYPPRPCSLQTSSALLTSARLKDVVQGPKKHISISIL